MPTHAEHVHPPRTHSPTPLHAGVLACPRGLRHTGGAQDPAALLTAPQTAPGSPQSSPPPTRAAPGGDREEGGAHPGTCSLPLPAPPRRLQHPRCQRDRPGSPGGSLSRGSPVRTDRPRRLDGTGVAGAASAGKAALSRRLPAPSPPGRSPVPCPTGVRSQPRGEHRAGPGEPPPLPAVAGHGGPRRIPPGSRRRGRLPREPRPHRSHRGRAPGAARPVPRSISAPFPFICGVSPRHHFVRAAAAAARW